MRFAELWHRVRIAVGISRLLGLTLGMAALTAVSSCNLAVDRGDAKALADRYFAASENSDYDGIIALYSPEFLSKTPREQIRRILLSVHNRCGIPKSHTLQTWRVFSDLTRGSTQVDLSYDVTYSRCRMSERIVVARHHGEKVQILSHNFNLLSGTTGQDSGLTTT